MVKVKIYGMSRNESEVFEILDRQELEGKIDSLNSYEIYYNTLKKAYEYSFSGRAYSYIDARKGTVHTTWMQQGNYLHPYDSFYEIVLCTVHTPLDIPTEEFFKDYEEEKRFYESEADLEEFFGKEEYESRIDTIFDSWASGFWFDRQNIREQLDELYSKVIE